MSTRKRGHASVLILTLVFSAIPLAWLPEPVAALTWTVTTIQGGLGDPYAGTPIASGGGGGLVAFSGSNVAVSYFSGPSADLKGGRSGDSGSTYSTATLDSTGVVGKDSNMAQIDGNSAGICSTDESNGDVKFYRTDDSGIFWSTGTVVADDNVGKCFIAASGETITAVYQQNTATHCRAKRSTDGGATWGAFTTVSTDCFAPAPTSFAAKDTSVLVVGISNGNTHRTTDGAATWGGAVPTGGNVVRDVKHVSGDTFVAVTTTGTTGEVRFVRSTNGGASWAGGTSFTHSEGIADASIVAADADSFSIFFCEAPHDSGQNRLYRLSTDDDGANWASELIQTGSGGNRGICDIGQSTIQDGRIFVALKWAENDGGEQWKQQVATAVFAAGAGPTVDANAIVTVNGLVGFDVDHDGNMVVARLTQGDARTGRYVNTFQSQSLVSVAIQDTRCNRQDGVMASKTNVGYLFCSNDSPYNPDQLRIRTAGLTDNDVTGSGCGNDDVCPMNIDLATPELLCTGSFRGRNVFLQIQQIDFAPINWSRVTQQRTFAADTHAVAWSYQTTNREVGVAEYTARDQGCDVYADQQQIYGSSVPETLCTWTHQGNLFIAAGATDAALQIFPWSPSIEDISPNTPGDKVLRGTLGSSTPYPGLSPVMGIACAGDTFIVETTTDFTTYQLYKYTRSTGQLDPDYPVSYEFGALRGVTMSGDGLFGTFVSSGTPKIFRVSDGVVLRNLTGQVGVGGFKDMRMDRTAQNLWVGYENRVARWVIYPFTTINPVSSTGGGTVVLPTITPTASGPLKGLAVGVGKSFGTGAFGGGLFISGLIIFGMAVTGTGFGAAGTRSIAGSIVLGIVGAICGILLSWGMGFLGDAAIFAVIVLAVVAIVVVALIRG